MSDQSSFSVRDDEPFVIFRILQQIARESCGEDIIDLSRGDPGYGFVPSVRGREFASLVLVLDSSINHHASALEMTQLSGLMEYIDSIYLPEKAQQMKNLLQEFIAAAIAASSGEKKKWVEEDVLKGLFDFAAMSGGSYLDPRGQELTRMIVADWHSKQYGVSLTSDDIILTSGVSHGIGALFKAFGEEGCGYLTAGDTVLIGSPVYSPYNGMLEERGIKTMTFSVDPINGQCSIPKQVDGCKALILIDPNNPTGFSLSEDSLEELAKIVKEQNMLVLTDEVYSSFFPSKKTMLSLAPEHTIAMNARSKMERSTGLRFGEIISTVQGRNHIASIVSLADGDALIDLIIKAKGPGRAGGQLKHTTFVPGPSQLLGIAHLLLGKEERDRYRIDLQENTRIFSEELALPHSGNLYYTLFDLDQLEGCTTSDLPIEERLVRMAQKGVVFIPAYKFFSPEERKKPGVLMSVRASVVNTTGERLKEAAKRVRDVLC